MSTTVDAHDADNASHRACANCRSQKVRCIVDESNPHQCQRCARVGRQCVFSPLRKRKQRKRTDTRVAELEREMQTMRSMMRNKVKESPSTREMTQEGAPVERPAGLWFEHNKDDAAVRAATGEPAFSFGSSHTPQSQSQHGPLQKDQRASTKSPASLGDPSKDIIDRDLISMATARQLFETYRQHLFPLFPVIVVPPSVSADYMRRTQPTLFLAILAAAATKDNPDLSPTLDEEIRRTYAMKTVWQSEKSLELIQALLISSAWYHPPNKYGDLKYYQYIHMAETMALDLGIGTRPLNAYGRTGMKRASRDGQPRAIHPLEDASNPDLSMTPRSRDSSPEKGSLESRRTLLGCYSMSTAVALSLRRPNMFRATSYVKECVDYLERSPNAVPSDRMLVAWIRLMMLGEEIANSFSFEDSSNTASIAELRTQLMMKQFTKRIDEWHASVSEDDMIGSLKIMYWTTRLYIYQIVLLIEHSTEDFKAPYQMGTLHTWNGDDIPTQILAEAIAECITCSQNLLDTFTNMDVEQLRALPVFGYVRVSFAAFVLVKLCLSAVHPGSKIGSALDRDKMKAEKYLDQAVMHVRTVVGPLRCRVPAVFLALLFKLRQWCLNPKIIEHSEKMLEPVVNNQSFNQKSQERSTLTQASEHPRITEHASSAESSPQTSLGTPAAAPEEQRSLKPARQPGLHNFDDGSIGLLVANTDTGPDMSSYLNSNEQMHWDQDFMQFAGDFTGDLSSFNDWSNMVSTEFLGVPDDFNFQPIALDDGTMRL